MKRSINLFVILLILASLLPFPAVVANNEPHLAFVESHVDFDSGYTVYDLIFPEASKTSEQDFAKALDTLTVSKLISQKGRFADIKIEWLYENKPYQVSVNDYGLITDSVTFTIVSEKDISKTEEECTLGNCSDPYKYEITIKAEDGLGLGETNDTRYVIGFYNREVEKDQITYFYHSWGITGSHMEWCYKDSWDELKTYSVTKSAPSLTASKIDTSKTDTFYNVQQDNKLRIRFIGKIVGAASANGYEVALDHVPFFAAKEYNEYAWWNASWPYRKCLNITGSA